MNAGPVWGLWRRVVSSSQDPGISMKDGPITDMKFDVTGCHRSRQCTVPCSGLVFPCLFQVLPVYFASLADFFFIFPLHPSSLSCVTCCMICRRGRSLALHLENSRSSGAGIRPSHATVDKPNASSPRSADAIASWSATND